MILVLLACSCTEDENTVLSNDCYISSFTLGNVKQQIYSTTEAGEDTSYTVTYNASYYPMTIDQLKGSITNTDSLPIHSNPHAILATIQASGTLIYRYADEAGENWLSYSSTDSIDFSHPLVFRVTSYDGMAQKDYQVKLNIHQQDADKFSWNKVTESDLWAAAEQVKFLIWRDKIFVFAQSAQGIQAFSSASDDGATWTEVSLQHHEKGMIHTLTEFNDRLYMSGTDGTLLMSEDARTWNLIEPDRTVSLLTTHGTYLYALSGQSIVRSTDAVHWTDEVLDEDVNLLPTQDITAVAYTQANRIERILLAGNRDTQVYLTDTAAVVWGKTVSPYETSNDTQWIYYTPAPDNKYTCPQLKSLHLIAYDEVILALGRESLNGTSHKALDQMYVSQDNGITWKTNASYTLPAEVRNKDAVLSVTTDQGFNIWLLAGTQLWKGRLNKLSFDSK